MDYGINIWIGKLKSIEILSGNRVKLGGGTNSKDLIDALWAAGKQAVTGTCECVNYMGPALGGGHGWLQGRHGLIADQFLSMNVVLADGTLRTIGPSNELFWAMKGAGHNFGIVTSVTIKTFDIAHTNWAGETLMFTGDKVEDLYALVNEHHLKNGTQPVDLINWSYWFNIDGPFNGVCVLILSICLASPPALTFLSQPVIAMYIIQEGVTSVDASYTAPFHALGPFSAETATGDYRNVSKWVGIAKDDGPCQNVGNSTPRFPAYLPNYNPSAMREVYDAYKNITGDPSSPYHGSLFMFEGYSMQGVQATNADSAAFAYRQDNLLTAPMLLYTPAGAARDAEAQAYGNQMRQILVDGSGRSELHAYVNYAYGDETPDEWYGHESWRQSKLHYLKNKYDPHGRFSFYAPIA